MVAKTAPKPKKGSAARPAKKSAKGNTPKPSTDTAREIADRQEQQVTLRDLIQKMEKSGTSEETLANLREMDARYTREIAALKAGGETASTPKAPVVPKPTAPRAASVPAPKFAIGDTVEVFHGTYWLKGNVASVDGQKYKVEYGSRYTPDEWAEGILLRAAGSGPNRAVEVGDRVEVFHRFVGGKNVILPAVVVTVEKVGVIVRCEGSGNLAHLEHYVTNSDDRMNSAIVRILDR
jgi:hypothetical protein